MAEYLHPGVYVQELPSGAHTIAPSDTSTACFLGEAVTGRPFHPTLVTSFTEFERIFGGLVRRAGDTQRELPFAAQQFFVNGGSRLYVVRMLDSGTSEVASGEVGALFTLEASGDGGWGNELRVMLSANALHPDRVDVFVSRDRGAGPNPVEQHMALSLDPGGAKDYASSINRDSDYLAVPASDDGSFWEGSIADLQLGDGLTIELTGGHDGDVSKALSFSSFGTAMACLHRTTDINILSAPGVTDVLPTRSLVAFAEDRRDLFVVLDGPGDQQNAGATSSLAQVKTHRAALPDSDYAALYWPWIQVPDPYTTVTSATRFAPPSGFVCGLYARTDNSRGVWKAPAGLDANVDGAVGLSVRVSDADQDSLNPVGINVIRQFNAAGIVVWGARTLAAPGTDSLYVPTRRLATFLEWSIERGTRWVVFEPNDETLWTTIRRDVGAFVSQLWKQGALQGSTPEEAYFVHCDSTTNSQANIDAGQVHFQVGFAPMKPNEFMTINFVQVLADS